MSLWFKMARSQNGLLIVFVLASWSTNAENIARGKPTGASSSSGAWQHFKTVDGGYSSYMWDDQCWHGGPSNIQWLTVDLAAFYLIERVVLTNRNEIRERLDNVRVEGYNVDPYFPGNLPSLCGVTPGGSGDVVTLNCNNGAYGRYVRLQGGSGFTICEMEIYGTKVGDKGIPDCSSGEALVSWGKSLTAPVSLGVASSNADCVDLCYRNPACSVAAFDNYTMACSASYNPVNPDNHLTSTIYFVP